MVPQRTMAKFWPTEAGAHQNLPVLLFKTCDLLHSKASLAKCFRNTPDSEYIGEEIFLCSAKSDELDLEYDLEHNHSCN